MKKPDCKLASALMFLLELLVQIGGGQVHIPLEESANDSCDHTIWDTTWERKGVRQVKTTCSEGHIDWKHPYGAIRVTFQLGSRTTDLEACFKAKAHFTIAKISLESYDSQTSAELEDLVPLVMLNYTNPQMTREICLRTKPHQSTALTLFIEAHSDLSATTIGQVQLEYDIQKNYASYSYDDMEECRPCTDSELLEAVCTHDFVAKGSIEAVFHNSETQESEVRIDATNIIRQRSKIFRKIQSSDDSVLQMIQKTPQYKGAVYFPQKCGIRKGEGNFLFLGKIRLGRALLHCAPRLEDFETMWRRAVQQGRNLCLVD